MTVTIQAEMLFRPSLLDPGPREEGHRRDAGRPHVDDGLRRDGTPLRDHDRGGFPAMPLRGDGSRRSAALDRRPVDAGCHHPQRPAAGGGLTLDELVVGVWEDLSAHRTVPCPACGAAMTPRYGAGHAPVGGRCTSCRTTIA